MKFESGILVGVCRPVPDCLSFVTPVFETSDGDHVVQRVAGGRVVGFEEIDLGQEFVPLRSTARVNIGDGAIYGMEFEDCISIGPALTLGNFRQDAQDPENAPALSCIMTTLEKSRHERMNRFLVFRKADRSCGDENFEEISVATRIEGTSLQSSVRQDQRSDICSEVYRRFTFEERRHFLHWLRIEARLRYAAVDWGVAAMAAVMLSIGFFVVSAMNYGTLGNVTVTTVNESRAEQLKDGSVVSLGARSQLRIDFTEKRRVVHLLKGKVMFNVAEDTARPFVVSTNLVDAIAVGTKFSVVVDTSVIVHVHEGVVVISRRGVKVGSPVVALKRGESLSVSADGLGLSSTAGAG